MTDQGEEGQRMRQSSPFAGEVFIRQAERIRVIEKISERSRTAREAWDKELRRRGEEILSGAIKGIPAEEVFAQMASKYQQE
jgi:hypothetical protein